MHKSYTIYVYLNSKPTPIYINICIIIIQRNFLCYRTVRFNMKSFKLVHLLLLLFLLSWDEVSCLCSLDQTTAARCHDLEDARYIETYHLHTLRAPSYSKLLSPGNFRNLTSLRHLDLSDGRIESIESGSFAKLRSLQTLNLAENKLRHLEAGAFDGLKHVHSLKLGDNDIRQLPSALMSLKELRLLDLSNNPLNCNCPSMKLRDALLARGVKISKKTTCAEPASVKNASILKPDTKITCLFETQDEEMMQADQPIDDGSGEAESLNEEDETLDEAEKDLDAEEKELEQPEVGENEAGTLTPVSASQPSSSIEPVEASSTEDLSVTTIASKDDITFDDTEREATTSIPVVPQDILEKSTTDEPIVEPNGIQDDLVYAVAEKKNTTIDDKTIVSTKPEITDDIVVPDEGSGESDADLDEGSGSEGSGMIARMPAIDFNETGSNTGDEEVQISSSSTTSTTTEGSIWGGWNLGSVLSNFNPFGSETTEKPKPPPEKSPEEEIKEDGFIPATQEPPVPEVFDVVEDPVAPPKIVVPDEALKQSPRTLEVPKEVAAEEPIDTNDLSDPEKSTEPKKGLGSYIVLAALLAILGGLIGIAAYKGDFCRKKRKRNDVERGTELKDMQRSLLEQNSGAVPAKIQANGNTMENVPLMTCTPPEEPKDNQRSYDISPTAPITNGSSRPIGFTQEVIEPVKPPRKGQDIEAPLNGLNPPMEAIDAVADDPRTSLHSNCSDELLQNNGDYNGERPPLTPGAQRVKITMQDNPDSVPKTPVLITRLKGVENLVKTP